MSTNLIDEMNTEWAVIASSHLARRQLRTWQCDDGVFDGLSTLDELVVAIQWGDPDRARALCWALLGRPDEELAVRTMLQPLVGGLANMVRDLAKGEHGEWIQEEVIAALLFSAIEAVTHLAGTRTRWPILDLLRRTKRVARRTLRSNESWNDNTATETSLEDYLQQRTEVAPVLGGSGAAEELADVLASGVAEGTLTAGESELIFRTRVAGYQCRELAKHYGVADNTLLQRRLRAENRLIARARLAS